MDEKTIRNKFSAELKKRENENILEFQQKKQKLIDKQFEVAMEGNPVMLVWLGKNWLKQKDNMESSGEFVIRIIKEEIKS